MIGEKPYQAEQGNRKIFDRIARPVALVERFADTGKQRQRHDSQQKSHGFKAITLLLALLPSLALAQAVRFDSASYTTAGQAPLGAAIPVLAMPGATVAVCQDSLCVSRATTYTNATAGTPCASLAPLTPAAGGACIATTDNQGNFGFWILPGSYWYQIAFRNGATYGPYPISLGASAGCPLGVTCDATFGTLAAAVTAAGNGSLYITKAWNGTSSLTAVSLTFQGNGKIAMAAGQALTVTGTIAAPPGQQIFDTSASGSSVVLSAAKVPEVYPQWWGAAEDGSTNDATAFNGMLATAKAAKIPVSLLAGNYRVGSSLSILNGATGMTIKGAGSELTTISTAAASIDLMAAISSMAANPIYNISGIKFVGPDSSSSLPCDGTTTSGNGLRISGSATALVHLSDIYITGFCGSGKAGLYLDNAENFNITGLNANFNDVGLLLTNVTSTDALGTVNNSNITQNRSYGIEGIGGQNVAFINLGVQSNYKTGLYLKNWNTSVFIACHMENNNTSADGSSHGTYLDGSSGSGLIGNVFSACSYNGPSHEDIYLLGGGNGITANEWRGGISSSAPTPFFIEDGTNIGGNTIGGLFPPSRITTTGINLELFCQPPDVRSIIGHGCGATSSGTFPLHVAQLPVAAYLGYMLASVDDALTPVVGSAVTGGGSATALVWNDGARGWLVYAK